MPIDHNKFINCAIDADATYIVSGDEDLLILEKVKNVEIITAKELCERLIIELNDLKFDIKN